jgi:CheY-like chemotaxis protein
MAKILIVEDDANNTDIMRRFLRLQRHDVIAAGDGAEAVALARSEAPQLILMDMRLPVLDGWEATRRLRGLPETRHIPIIALTASAMAGDREKTLQAGCDDYESKPVEFARLGEKIRKLLEKQSSHDQ